MALPKLLREIFENDGAGPKFRADKIPVTQVTVDSALSSTSENPVQNKVINSALDGKLSLSGGTMTGDIIFSSYLAKIANDKNDGGKVEVSQTGAALLSNQDNYEGGATLLLRSSTYPNEQKGHFFLLASLSSSQSCRLVGSPDGSLTWGGHKVITVVAESYSANRWYRKYSDGWIEQGGRVSIPESSSTSVTFLVPFKDTNYTVSSADTENLDALEYTNSVSFGKSTTGLVIKHHNYAAHYDWRAAGF